MNLRIFTFLPALATFLLAISATGQEAEPEKDPKSQEKRTEGPNKSTDRIQNFSFLDYARKLADKFDSRERKVDPFGMAMDPEENVPELVFQPGPDSEEAPKTTLQQAVSKFRVTGYNRERKEIIVGAQSLRIGDHIVIEQGGVSFHLQIKEIQKDSIQLVDVETGEVAGTSLGVVQGLPLGMTREQPTRSTGKEDPVGGGRIVPMSQRYLSLKLDSVEENEEGDNNFSRLNKKP